jgi:class 3 adenylate cyclase
MRTHGSRTFRRFGEFWARQQEGALARLANSGAFVPVMLVIMVAGLVLFWGFPLSESTSRDSLVSIVLDLAIFAVGLAWGLLILLLILSKGSIAMQSADHSGAPEQVLARCREMLERHGFTVQAQPDATLHASRGRSDLTSAEGMTENEWRSFPLEARLSATSSATSVKLDVQCRIGIGFFSAVRQLALETCKAIAEINDQALGRLDTSIPIKQNVWFLGGLGSRIFVAMLICTGVAVAVFAGISYLAGMRALEFVVAETISNSAVSHIADLVRAIDAPLRKEVQQVLATPENTSPKDLSAEHVARRIAAARAGRDVVVAIRQPEGAITLLHPPDGHPLRAIVMDTLSESNPAIFRRVGDRVLRTFATTSKVLKLTGSEGGSLVVGELHSYADLAQLAPKTLSGKELAFFHDGRPAARFNWKEFGKVEVDRGSASLPKDVVERQMQKRSADGGMLTAFMDLILGERGAWAGELRDELRDGQNYRVHYELRQGGGTGSAWSGYSFAQVSGLAEPAWAGHVRETATGLGSIGVLLVLILTFVTASIVSARMSRPVLEVRDALRLISEGDYTVRINADRTDEIGQLQKLLNYTAEELKKRESIKELMGKYLSKQVADRIMEGDSDQAMAGIRKEVSILFADVRGFTAYSEKHDPEQVTKSLNEYFEVMVDVIAVHEGVLDKYIGDGLMVVFGAPMAQPDHARRAVITALEMQAALQSLNLKRAQRGDDPIHIGIGVNTGLAISGNLGSIKRMEFTVIGDTVNTAARLESNAKQGQILIGKVTYEKVKDLIECEPLGQITVKGKTDPVDIWWLKGLRPQRA